MKYFSPHIMHKIVPLSIIGVFFTVLYIVHPNFLTATKAESATNSLSGFAWSDTVGWISFSNTSDGSASVYSVKVDTVTGAFSGYAWSDNIGWISFNRTVTNNPPSAPFNTGSGSIAKIDLTTGKATGWARALSGCEEVAGTPVISCASTNAGLASAGWDGWIKLSDDTNTNWLDKGVLVDVFTGDFSGYAWGSEVVGWVDFAAHPTYGGGVKITPPFKCSPLSDPYGVCDATQVCLASGGGTCILPNGSCSTDSNCGGSQVCKNGTCRPPDYCTSRADCPSGICDLETNKCAASGGSGCGDSTCSAGETLLICPWDCKGKVKQF